MLQKKEPTLCLSCEKPVKGRSDKKFCDDYCRAAYNNDLKSASNNLVRNVNNALGKNRRILESLLPQGDATAKTNHDKLIEKGFQFKFTDSPKMTKSMHIALNDLQLDDLTVIIPGRASFKMHEKVQVLGLEDFLSTTS